jgi:hypothetical protein
VEGRRFGRGGGGGVFLFGGVDFHFGFGHGLDGLLFVLVI